MATSGYYPDWLPDSAICQMEGCDFGSGSACWRCGARLRCDACGRFVRAEFYEVHFASRHADLIVEVEP